MLLDVIELTSEAVLVAVSGILTEVNDAACQLLGYPRAALIAQPLVNLLVPEASTRLADALVAVEPQTQIWSLRRQDDRLLTVEARAKLLPDGRWIAFLRPLAEPAHPSIASALQAEPALQAQDRPQERQLQQLSDTLPQMVWITDAVGTLEYVNQRWIEYSGFTLEQSRSPAFIDQYHHADDRQRVFDQWAIALETQKPFEVEGRLKRSDGMYRWFLMRAVPAFDFQGQVLRWYGTSTDIHDRKLAELNEQFLNDLDSRLRQLTDADAMQWEVVSRLGEYLKVDRALWSEVDWENKQITIYRGWQREGLPSHAGTYALANFISAELQAAHAAGEPVVLPDVLTHPDSANCADTYQQLGIGALLSVPCIHEGRWVAALAVNSGTARRWRSDEIALLQATVARLWLLIEQMRTMQALRDSEARFRTLADNIAQFAWIADETGWIFWYNQRWFDYTGTTLAEMQGWGWQKVHHPDHLDRVVEQFRRCIELGETWEDTFPLRGRDGQYRWFLSRAIPIRDRQGRVLRWFGTNTDITDRQQAELEREQNQATIRSQLAEIEAIYQTAPIGLAILDRELRFVRLNQRLAAINGIAIADHLGRSVREIVPDLADQSEPLLRQVIETGEPLLNLEISGETAAQPGLQRTWIENWFPLRDRNGQITGINAVVQEITDRKRAEADLQERNQHIELLYETSRDLLSTNQPLALVETIFAKLKPLIGLDVYFNYVLDEAQQQLHLNFYGGISDEIAHAIEWLELGRAVCGTVAQQRCQLVQSDLQHSTDPQAEFVRSLGLTAYSCQPLVAQGKLFGTLGFGSRSRTAFTTAETNLFQAICDQIAIALERSALMSSLQQQTEELQRVNRLKDDFFSALSHELRTPLNPILGWTQMLKGHRLAPEKANQALETIERNTKQMVNLVNDLLDVGRVIRGRFQLDSRPIDLTLTLSTAIGTVQFAAQAKGITIEYHPSEIIYTQGDGDRLQQIFWNLLSNAIKFTPIGGSVEVRLEQVEDGERVEGGEMGRWGDGEMGSSEGVRQAFSTALPPDAATSSSSHPLIPSSPHPPTPTYAQITITDTGIGIPPDFLPHVFEHFRQAESGSTRSYGGLGLGLAIVRHLVELHGGTITATSLGEGRGSTFTVKLPLLPAPSLPMKGAIDGSDCERGTGWTAAAASEPVSLSGVPSQFLSPNDASAAGSRAVQIRVLVLDDEPDNLALVRFLLEQEGLTVLAVTSPLAALDAIAQSPPDLLVSDIGMPEMDGYEFIRRVRAMPSRQDKQIPAIALTAFAQPEDQKRAIESGFQAFIPKPVDPLLVIETVTQFVS